MTSSLFSDLYAGNYDMLYADKDYRGEADYVAKTLLRASPTARSVLEFGSGTGRHAALLAADGFDVVGIERSAPMLARAQDMTGERTRFIEGDIRTDFAGKTFDCVIALFHVVSYLGTNEDILAAFRNARRHLTAGGLFMFDFWYGPAVLTTKPENRIKEVTSEGFELTRFAQTSLDVNKNIATVHYSLFLNDLKSGRLTKETEVHEMRYLFLPEIQLLLQLAGFVFDHSEAWLTGGLLDSLTWTGTVIAKATPF